MDTETEFFVCDSTNIGDFLYELSGNFLTKEAAKSFDFIDMVFIEGDANLRPWSPNARNFLMLIKNCLITNKILWASQFAMQCLIYLISSDIEKQVNIVNGSNGTSLKSNKIEKQYPNGLNDYFLDNISGDMYQWDTDNKEWKPSRNTGLHCRKAAQESLEFGKLVMKTEVHRMNQQHKSILKIYESQINECICYVKKIFMNHYALLDCEFEFIVPSKNQWDAHPITFINPQKTYTVLAESRFTVQIIEINEFTLGTQFNLSQKYPYSIQVFCNFVKHQMEKIKNGRRSIPIKDLKNKNEETTNTFQAILMAKKESEEKQDQKKNQASPCFRHSGFAMKKLDKEDLVVQNNAFNVKNVHSIQQIEFIKQEPLAQSKYIETTKRPQTAITNNKLLRSQNNIRKSSQNKQDIENSPGYIKEDFEDQKEMLLKNQSEIRLMLHPSLSKQGLQQKDLLWVSGADFTKNMNKANQISYIRALENQKIIRVPSCGPMKKLSISTKVGMQKKQKPLYEYIDKEYNPFIKKENCENIQENNQNLKQNRQFKSLSKIALNKNQELQKDETYAEKIEKQKQKEKEEMKKNLGDRFFHTGTIQNYKIIKNFDFSNMYFPISKHQYRECNPQRWVSKNAFLL